MMSFEQKPAVSDMNLRQVVRSPQFGYFAFHSPFPQTANQRSVYDLKRMHSGSGVFCIDETDVKSSIACKKENVCKATLVRIPLLFNKAHRKRTIYKAKSKKYQQKENILSDVLFLLPGSSNSDIFTSYLIPSSGKPAKRLPDESEEIPARVQFSLQSGNGTVAGISELAEMEGFEPPHALRRLPDFESGPFSHLGTSPISILLCHTVVCIARKKRRSGA